MGDLIFALFHLGLLLALVIYAFYSLILGNSTRFGLILAGLFVYYILVLHKPVVAEIRRLKEKRAGKN